MDAVLFSIGVGGRVKHQRNSNGSKDKEVLEEGTCCGEEQTLSWNRDSKCKREKEVRK